jgi:hypothetical protein
MQAHGTANLRKAAYQMLYEEFMQTQLYWTGNCVICFVRGDVFDHARSDQCGYTRDLTAKYKASIGGRYAPDQCWGCVMPMSCCPKYHKEGTTSTRLGTNDSKSCLNKFAINDTWANLWGRCRLAKEAWKTYIEETGGGVIDDDDPAAFSAYFSRAKDNGNGLKAGNIVLGVNWLTHKYFIGDGKDPRADLLE